MDRCKPPLAAILAGLLFAVAVPHALAQQPAVPPPDDEDGRPADEAPPEAEAVAPERYGSPYAAYDAGDWEQSLQGFVDQQIEHPENPEVALNLGSVHYQMKNYEEADRAFASAALSGQPGVRNQALYNLGNSAYRQGRLPEAVQLFQAALDVDPEDEDAKFNLEFVRDEIRRRHEEAQKQQEQQGDQQQQQQGQQQQQPQGGQEGPQDSDRDGLPDQVEREGQNPTDPHDPDTDGDGLADGQEDQNRNGQVDEGETDPNNPDSDGDGVSDGEEAQQEEQAGQGQEQPEDEEGLTPEEAERYLQALEEGRPDQRRAAPSGRRARPEKDW